MPTIQSVISLLETIAPPGYQESYDNAGLITGDAGSVVRGVLCCLDATEAVVAEAADRGCNLVVAHHPIVFRGLKKLSGGSYVERALIRAIREDIAIYAVHTNLDKVYDHGVNTRIAAQLGLQSVAVLSPSEPLQLLRATVTAAGADTLAAAWQEALPMGSVVSIPVETADRSASLRRLEAVSGAGAVPQLLAMLRESGSSVGPAEQLELRQKDSRVGLGAVGYLPEPLPETEFLALLKKRMKTPVVRHTALRGKAVRKVALCGGAGSFLLPAALRSGSDIFVTADYKYHEFFDADGKIVIADIGHYESEQFTIDLLREIISEKFPTFATLQTTIRTNPVLYF
ncbi:MAG: hypothetical protein RLY31_30 [Bacteroidota bacterium]|jgi:dinuclear metal center YbgI/SA1388 family protein